MKLKMSKEVDLGNEPIGHLLFVLAVPSIISQVVNALYKYGGQDVYRTYSGRGCGSTYRTWCMFSDLL